jgi:hypothetical protein
VEVRRGRRVDHDAALQVGVDEPTNAGVDPVFTRAKATAVEGAADPAGSPSAATRVPRSSVSP